MARINHMSTTTASQRIMTDTLNRAGTAEEKKQVEALFQRAAGVDGNRHLSAAEAQLVKDAFDASATSSPTGQPEAASTVASFGPTLTALLSRQNPEGVDFHFTSTTRDMGKVITDAIEDTIAVAAGKPVDVNVMIFAFTHDKMGSKLLDLAKQHPNVTFRFLADSTQLTNDGQRQLPRLQAEAAALGLTNIDMRFKKDAPYVYNATLNRADYSHSESSGLNHHKGLVTLIDGRPHKLVTGSFNWSETAADKNYENLVILDSKNAGNRGVMQQYQSEFVSFFNHDDSLNFEQAKEWKRFVLDQVKADKLPARTAITDAELAAKAPDLQRLATPRYAPRTPGGSFDINALSDEAAKKLTAALGTRLANAVIKELANGGRFTSVEEIIDRLKTTKATELTKLRALDSVVVFGSGLVPVNASSSSELERCFKGLATEKEAKKMAQSIVALRGSKGDIDAVADLRALPGFANLSDAMFQRVTERLSDDVGRAFFSSRSYSDVRAGTTAGTGYAAENATATVPVMGANGAVTTEKASLAAGVVDMFRRIPAGQQTRVAMYGLSESTPEFAEMLAAAKRGVPFQVILNDDNSAAMVAAFKRHIAAGVPFDVRIQKAKTMHEKFGVSGDDSFQGSANFSGSSAGKNSEDRFVFKNAPKIAQALNTEFDLIWGKSRPI